MMGVSNDVSWTGAGAGARKVLIESGRGEDGVGAGRGKRTSVAVTDGCPSV